MQAVSAHTRATLSARVQSAAVELDVVFLGTSGSMPTARRALPATLVRRGGERLLVDCSEGTQRQLLRSDVGLVDLEDIFLTHYHADHYLGLPGMLKTFALRGREIPLSIYGPPGLDDLMGTLRRVFGRLTYPVWTVEVGGGEQLDRDGYVIEAFAVDHGVSAIGYAFVEEERPGPVRRRGCRQAGRAPGPRARRAATRRERRARRRSPRRAFGCPRRAACRAEDRDHGRYGTDFIGGRGGRGRRSSRARVHVSRGRARPRPRDVPLRLRARLRSPHRRQG